MNLVSLSGHINLRGIEIVYASLCKMTVLDESAASIMASVC